MFGVVVVIIVIKLLVLCCFILLDYDIANLVYHTFNQI